MQSLIQLKFLNNVNCLSVYGLPLSSYSDCLLPLEVPSSFAAEATGTQIRSSIYYSNPAAILKRLSLNEVILTENLVNNDFTKPDVDVL